MQYKLLLIVIAIMLCITIEVTQSSTEQMYNDLRNFVIQDGLISIDQVEACDPDFPSIYYMASKSSTCAYFVCAGGYAVQKFCPLGTRLEDSFYQGKGMPCVEISCGQCERRVPIPRRTELPSSKLYPVERYQPSENPCHPNPCRNHGQCYPEGDLFWCRCRRGYQGSPTCHPDTNLDYYSPDRNGEHTVIVSRENATSHTVTNIEGVTKTTPDINTLWSTPTEPLTQHSGHLPSTSDQVTPYVLPDRTPSTPPPPRAPYPRTQTTPYSPPPPRAPHPRTQTTPYAPPPPKTPYTRPTTATRSTANTTPQTPLPAPKTFSNVKETLKIGGICRGRYDERCEQLDSNTACKRNKGIYICECKASYIARGGDECVKKKAVRLDLLPCRTDADCQYFLSQFTECKADGICRCKVGYKALGRDGCQKY